MGFTLPNLKIFFAGLNKFSGYFPQSITNATKLVSFDISCNNVSGPLPMNWGSLSRLKLLNLGFNQLGHNQSPGGLSFVRSLVNSSGLKYLCLYENGLSGKLPKSIVNLTTTLHYLLLDQNYIYGSIPQEIGIFFNLTYLSLYKNMLTGRIPESVCKLTKLETLFLDHNNISGVIPVCISNIWTAT